MRVRGTVVAAAVGVAIAAAVPATASASVETNVTLGPYPTQAKCEEIRYGWDNQGGVSHPCFAVPLGEPPYFIFQWYFHGAY
ncbi:hypothetical protein AB0E69_08110 [Kribbella sp. NPDC026611]|uniref:hypothetical protein n=1 Tax=Kribbella sp. NPDC026611 TaxID=3154911 RepID=UPI0033EE6E07